MSIACPHCQSPVTAHPQTGAWPAFCAQCGQRLEPPAAADPNEAAPPNLASLLRPTVTTASATEAPEPVAEVTEPVAADDASAATDTTAVDATEPESTPTLTETVSVPVVAHADDETEAGATNVPLPAVSAAATTSAAPSFMQRQRRSPTARHARWQWVAVVALGVLLVLQMLLADRYRLATQAGWRPLLGGLCAALSCDLPPWRDPQAFTMISRDVRPLPQRPGVLLAQATFRNDAHWPQPWPILMVTLKDADGRTLGARALQPGDYLDSHAVQDEIAPGQSAQVAVRLREPSASVVAFSFDFR